MSKQLPELLSKHDLGEIKTKLPDDLYQRVSTAVYNGELARAMLVAGAASDEGRQKSVATVRVTHGGYGMELNTYVAYALQEGKHELYAHPLPHKATNGLTAERVLDIWERYPGVEFVDQIRAAAGRTEQRCDLAPQGWYCSREKGHAGPCAAHPEDGDDNDAIARSKRVLALVDTYVERQSAEARYALRNGLMREFGTKV